MTIYSGQFGQVKVGTVAAVETKNFTVDQSAAVVNGTAMGDAWERNAATQKSFSGKAQFNLDSLPAGIQVTFVVGASIAFKFYPIADVVAADAVYNVELVGTGIITKRSISSSFDGIATLDIEFTGTGTMTETVI